MICMFTCLLLDPFQLYIEMSVVFRLSIYTDTANSCTLGMKMCWDFLGGGEGGSNKKEVL